MVSCLQSSLWLHYFWGCTPVIWELLFRAWMASILCNCGLFVRLNVYINLFFLQAGKGWIAYYWRSLKKSFLSKEVKAWLPVFKCFLFCSQDFFPCTLSRLSTFVPLNDSSSGFLSLPYPKRRPGPGESTGFRTSSPTKQYSTFWKFYQLFCFKIRTLIDQCCPCWQTSNNLKAL